MKIPFLSKKRSFLRGPDGKFTAADTDSTDMTVVKRGTVGFNKNIEAMTETIKAVTEMNKALKQTAIQDLELQRQYSDLINPMDVLEDGIEGGDSFEKMAMQMLMSMAQSGQLAAKPKDPWTEGDYFYPEYSANGTVQGLKSPPPPSPAPSPPQESNKQLNAILKGISQIPDKMISKEAVSMVTDKYGIDNKALMGAVKKLSKVV